MSVVVEKQTVIIHRNLAGPAQSFSLPLDLTFTPDQVIVRNISYSDGAGAGLHAVITPWIRSKEEILGIFDDTASASTSSPQTSYRIMDSATILNGDVTFQIRDVTTTLNASLATGNLALTLEFQKVEPRRSMDDVVIASVERMVKVMAERGCIYPFCLPGNQRQLGGRNGPFSQLIQQIQEKINFWTHQLPRQQENRPQIRERIRKLHEELDALLRQERQEGNGAGAGVESQQDIDANTEPIPDLNRTAAPEDRLLEVPEVEGPQGGPQGKVE